jgi:arylsulfatase A-like enzyme
MNDKNLIVAGGCLAGLMAASVPHLSSAEPQGKRPNILLIVADDFGIGSINAYGAPAGLVRTPHLNRLAEEGLRFTNASSPASVCSPTRYAMLTGRYAWRGPFPYGVHDPFEPASIEAGQSTVASMLQSCGYRTASIGKWHLGYGTPDAGQSRVDFTKRLFPGPNDIGFDYHFGIPQNLDDTHRVWIENDGVYGLRSDKVSPYGRSFYGGAYEGFDAPQRSREEALETVTVRAMDWIRSECRKESAQPFFLYFAPPAVHHPIVPSETMRGASGCGAYGDFIQDLDRSVGRLIDTLAYEGILDDTLVIFAADNGGDIPGDQSKPECQARRAGLLANGPQRGDKHTIYEGGLHIPLIVRWPGKVAAGSVSDHMVNLIDLYATVSEISGSRPLAENEAPDSISFLPTLLGKSQPARKPMVCNNVAGILALRDGAWKYIEGKFPGSLPPNDGRRNAFKDEAQPALYNLKDDPAEERNLIAEYPEKVKAMQKKLDDYRVAGRSR